MAGRGTAWEEQETHLWEIQPYVLQPHSSPTRKCLCVLFVPVSYCEEHARVGGCGEDMENTGKYDQESL